MGALLSEPVTAMVVERCSSTSWSAATATMQGWRRTNEDAHILCAAAAADEKADPNSGVFAVLDGHGGTVAALLGSKLLEERLLAHVRQTQTQKVSREESLKELFLQTDAELRQRLPAEDRSGSTVVAAIVTKERHEYAVQVAHSGDSRAVLSKNGTLICSEDHKPGRPDEVQRIQAAGGSVEPGPLGGGPLRVDGALAVSRSLGDFHFKPEHMDPAKCKVTAFPDVTLVQGCTVGDWLFLGCDGVFDVMENDEVQDFITTRLNGAGSPETTDLGELVADLLRHVLDKGSKDNCTASIVHFRSRVQPSPPRRQLLPGNWAKASPEVQTKYAEFFSSHGYQAEADTVRRAMTSQPGREVSTQSTGPSSLVGRLGLGISRAAAQVVSHAGQAEAPPPPRAEELPAGQRQLAAFARALQAIRSTRAIQMAWRARRPSGDAAPAPPTAGAANVAHAPQQAGRLGQGTASI